ncbi:MAG: FAD-dependent oxidoreductase, partial [Rubrobacteridae bacterium]|nr:FAD-dependent oxidoreductase [Rubrobacteridae bacterium]
MVQSYDVVVIGGGPAGLSAAIYATRSMLKVKLFEKEVIGGQASMTDHIENYPGFIEGISGYELTDKMREQALKLGAEIEMNGVEDVDLSGSSFLIKTTNETCEAKSLIIASGVRPTKLDIPGAAALSGRGISYCATCDGPFFRNKRVIIIGGGNSAVEEANYLTRFAESVTIVHRRDELRADKIVQKRAFDNPKISLMFDSVITEVKGETAVSAVTVRNVKTGAESEVPADGIFVSMGDLPNIDLFSG